MSFKVRYHLNKRS